ncbi:MAG TPA: DUF2243 domain-containing protein [Solirubrobacteraceae bacterium]
METHSGTPPGDGTVDGAKRSLISGVLVGVGFAGFVDETVFHQLLHWHHFYDKSTPSVGLVSDGFFHLATWVCIVAGLFIYADLRRRAQWHSLRQYAGFCLGLGGFQLYDGTLQHKVFHFHQIRYHVTIWPYDVTWNLTAAAVLIGGIVLLRRARHTASVDSTRRSAPRRQRAA